MADEKNSREYILQSVDNALRVLDSFNSMEPEMGVSELSRKLGLSKSAIFRIVSTLEARGFLTQNPGNSKYRLGLKLLRLGELVLNQHDLVMAVRPFLKEIVEFCDETAHLVVLEQEKTTFIDKVESARVVKMGSAIGESLPAYCTATGKVLLAALPPEKLDDYIKKTELNNYTSKTITEPDLLKQHLGDIKKQGYAVDNEEIEEGLVCIAVPLRNSSAQIIAAISISGMAVRMKRDLDGKIQLMKQFSKRISMQALGWNPS